jgi:hypothetical protein
MNKNFTMKEFLGITAVFSASIFIFLVYAKAASQPVLPPIKTPVPAAAVKSAEKVQAPATSYAETLDSEDDAVGHTAFDEFSIINDPLYREGSKFLLQKAIDEDNAPKAPVKAAPVKKTIWRDAPADIPAKAAQPTQVKSPGETAPPVVLPVKKNRLIKLIPADPVESKSTL